MRKIIISIHASLDGFVAGPGGEIDWIKVDETMFDLVGKFTGDADTALYGRVTYEMMDSYWPTAASGPQASKHDREHSAWYNSVQKIVLSKTMEGLVKDKTAFVGHDVPDYIEKLKSEPGKNILVFGSPTAVHLLMEHDLVDEYWLFVNPIILGEGIPLFVSTKKATQLKLLETKTFDIGVVGLHYAVVR